MMRFAPRFLGSGLGLAAVLGVSASAHAVAPPDRADPIGECQADADCGHGFECQSSITSASGGGRDVPGTGGLGGAGGAAGAAGTGSAGAPGTGGTGSGAPLPPRECGNGLCELPESPEACPSDCVVYRYCALAECDSASDCAEGYTCANTGSVGTGGGPSAPLCGDGVCNGGPESEATCPEDCATRSYCTPESGYCSSDADCTAGFFCSFYGSGTGGSSGGVGGSPGTGGFANPGGSAGASAGGTAGTAGAEGGSAGEAADPNPGQAPDSDAIAAQGTCMPGGGTGGVGGTSGSAGDGSGGISTGGIAGTTSSAGGATGGGAVSGSGGTSESSGGTGGTGSGGDPGTGARTGGGTSSSGGSGAASPGSSGRSGSGPKDDVVTSRGCSVSEGTQPSGFGALVFAALAFAGLRRRRARA